MEQRTLTAAFKFYCDEDMENAHSALYDTKVTWEVLKAQLNKYENLDKDVKKLADFSRAGNLDIYDFAGRLAINDKEEVIYNFGKNKGKTIEQVDQEEPGYYGWMMQADFPLYTKKCLKKEMDRIKAKRNKKVETNSIEDKLSALKKKFNS